MADRTHREFSARSIMNIANCFPIKMEGIYRALLQLDSDAEKKLQQDVWRSASALSDEDDMPDFGYIIKRSLLRLLKSAVIDYALTMPQATLTRPMLAETIRFFVPAGDEDDMSLYFYVGRHECKSYNAIMEALEVIQSQQQAS